MAASDAAPDPLDAKKRPVSGRQLRKGVGQLVVGLLIVWISLDPLGSLSGTFKVPLFLLGAVIAFRGAGDALRGEYGPRFPVGYAFSMFWVVGLFLASAGAALLPLGEHVDTSKTLADPGYARPDLFSKHPLGTNNFALDLLSQSIYGARVSLLTAPFAVLVSLVLGGLIGIVAGYFRGGLDLGVGVLTDAVLAVPPLIVLVALAAVLGTPQGLWEAVVKSGSALALVGVPVMIRLARANTLTVARREYVVASRSLGARHRRIIFREVLPNVILPLVSYAFIMVAILILAEGSLSFLGLGLQLPEPSWGNMIAQADVPTLRDHPHIALVPGVFMFVTVCAFNQIGEHARSAWDTRSSQL